MHREPDNVGEGVQDHGFRLLVMRGGSGLAGVPMGFVPNTSSRKRDGRRSRWRADARGHPAFGLAERGGNPGRSFEGADRHPAMAQKQEGQTRRESSTIP